GQRRQPPAQPVPRRQQPVGPPVCRVGDAQRTGRSRIRAGAPAGGVSGGGDRVSDGREGDRALGRTGRDLRRLSFGATRANFLTVFPEPSSRSLASLGGSAR